MDLYSLLIAPITPQENVPEREPERVKNDPLSGADCGSDERQNQCAASDAQNAPIRKLAELAVAAPTSEKFTHELISAVNIYLDGVLTQVPAGTSCFVATNCALAERRAKPVDKWGRWAFADAATNLKKGYWLAWLHGDWRGVKPEKIRRIKE